MTELQTLPLCEGIKFQQNRHGLTTLKNEDNELTLNWTTTVRFYLSEPAAAYCCCCTRRHANWSNAGTTDFSWWYPLAGLNPTFFAFCHFLKYLDSVGIATDLR